MNTVVASLTDKEEIRVEQATEIMVEAAKRVVTHRAMLKPVVQATVEGNRHTKVGMADIIQVHMVAAKGVLDIKVLEVVDQ